MPRKPLRQEQVPGRPVDVRDCCVPRGVEGVEPVEPGPLLPSLPGRLHPPPRDPSPRLVAEQRIAGCEALTAQSLESPEPLELRHEAVRQKDVGGPLPFRDLGPDSYAGLGGFRSSRRRRRR